MMFAKKKAQEPAYFVSLTNTRVLNYNVYRMSGAEKLLYTAISFVVGAAIGYLFYGGLGKDVYGNPTLTTYVCNVLISLLVGVVAVKLALPTIAGSLKEKRQRDLKQQFRDMLDSLATSLNAGKNVMDSFQSVEQDLKMQYEENAYILSELKVITMGIHNNIDIESLLVDFGERSGVEDISSFANVFRICYRKGGNLKEVIRNTHSIINDKMEIESEIKTMVSTNNLQQKIMIVIPVLLVGVIKAMSPEFAANFATPTGIFATTFAIVMFVVAYFVGKSILNIKL